MGKAVDFPHIGQVWANLRLRSKIMKKNYITIDEQNYSYRLALRDDILSNENEKVVEQKLVKMSKEDINAILCSVGVKAQKTTTIELMIKYGANVNAIRDEFGNTILMQLLVPHYSNHKKYLVKPEIVETFLKHGADAKAKNYKGITVLDYAKHINRQEIIDMLLNYGAC